MRLFWLLCFAVLFSSPRAFDGFGTFNMTLGESANVSGISFKLADASSSSALLQVTQPHFSFSTQLFLNKEKEVAGVNVTLLSSTFSQEWMEEIRFSQYSTNNSAVTPASSTTPTTITSASSTTSTTNLPSSSNPTDVTVKSQFLHTNPSLFQCTSSTSNTIISRRVRTVFSNSDGFQTWFGLSVINEGPTDLKAITISEGMPGSIPASEARFYTPPSRLEGGSVEWDVPLLKTGQEMGFSYSFNKFVHSSEESKNIGEVSGLANGLKRSSKAVENPIEKSAGARSLSLLFLLTAFLTLFMISAVKVGYTILKR